jgi:hypothetical protein
VIDARAAATISGRGERQLIRDTNDNQKLLARGTNRDDLAIAIGRRPSILIAAAVSPRLTRYTPNSDNNTLLFNGNSYIWNFCTSLSPS